MSEKPLRLGEILVDANVISNATLEKALAIQKKRQLRLGTILLQEEFVSEGQLIQALSLRLSIPWVSLWRINVPETLLKLVPVNIAEDFFLVPIYIRKTKDAGRALYVAMNDPTDEKALRFVSASSGMPVKPMIAGPSDIAEAIRFFYYGEEPEYDEDVEDPIGTPSVQAPPPPPPTGKQKAVEIDETEEIHSLEDHEVELETEDDSDETQETKENTVDLDSEDKKENNEDEEEIIHTEDKVFVNKEQAQREAEKLLFGVGSQDGKPAGGFSLTLLDGTTLAFGKDKKNDRSPSLSSENISQEDLLAGLKAAAQGAPMDDFLPSEEWQDYMAAIIKLLMKKHLIMFDELMNELKNK